jgi:hypothetical protein
MVSDPVFPTTWPRVARRAVLHVISLAATAVAVVRGRAIDSRSRHVRRNAEVEQLRNEIMLLREELRLKDARLGAVPPTRAGFWTMLRPFASLQRWPFGCWSAVAVDHFSRRTVGFAVFGQRPTAGEIPRFSAG